MKYPVIKIDDTLSVVVDERATINKDDWAYQSNYENTNPHIVLCSTDSQVVIANNKTGTWTKGKIIATIGTKRLEGVPMIIVPNQEVIMYYNEATDYAINDGMSDDFEASRRGYEAGYKAAQAKGSFSELDIRRAFGAGSEQGYIQGLCNAEGSEEEREDMENRYSVDNFLQSLKKKREIVGVELEMEKETLYTDDGLDYKGEFILKIHNKETNTIIPKTIIYEPIIKTV